MTKDKFRNMLVLLFWAVSSVAFIWLFRDQLVREAQAQGMTIKTQMAFISVNILLLVLSVLVVYGREIKTALKLVWEVLIGQRCWWCWRKDGIGEIVMVNDSKGVSVHRLCRCGAKLSPPMFQ
jgi:hypothetical protein